MSTTASNEGQASAPQPGSNIKWLSYIKAKEITVKVARQLLSVLTRVKVVLLVDDSSSMNEVIKEAGPGGQTLNLFAQGAAQKKRWDEVMQAAFELVTMVTSASDNEALDVWFFHHEAILNAHKVGDLTEAFSRAPSGNTPLISTLGTIYDAYQPILNQGTPVLLVVVSDGEPSDGTIADLEWRLKTKPQKLHLSFIECNDNEEEMQFMDSLDSRVSEFHNLDDYRLERQRVIQVQGSSFRFTYTDYIVMAVLSTFVPEYFLMDQNKTSRLTITPLPPMDERDLDALMEGYVEAKPLPKTRVDLSRTYAAVPVSQPRQALPVASSPSGNPNPCCGIL